MDSLWGNIFRDKNKKEESIITILKRIPFFEGLTAKELNSIKPILHLREYDENEIIFHQGDPGVGMYIIEKGTVKIIYEPTDRLLAELKDGEFFGELALLDESPRSAKAMAKTPCKIWGLFQPDLFGLLDRNPRLGVKFLLRLARVIGERLKRSNIEVQELQKELDTAKPILDEENLKK